jgi:osmoprotectant transport system ATP-binding protein
MVAERSTEGPLIELEGVEKRYDGAAAVADVTFRIMAGETFVLLGRSGSGKTTTLKMINRLVEPTAGTVRVFGKDVREHHGEELRRRIGYVIQQVGLFPHYSVRQNVGVVPALLGWNEDQIRIRVDELLEKVGLSPAKFADKLPDELSGGQQQRVGLARALAADPPIVLLDEPFGALDPITRREVQREFVRLSGELSKTMVLVTHDIAEAEMLGHRVCLFESGRIEQIGKPEELRLSPKSDVVRAFFEAARVVGK